MVRGYIGTLFILMAKRQIHSPVVVIVCSGNVENVRRKELLRKRLARMKIGMEDDEMPPQLQLAYIRCDAHSIVFTLKNFDTWELRSSVFFDTLRPAVHPHIGA